jgi:hypothetical protein
LIFLGGHQIKLKWLYNKNMSETENANNSETVPEGFNNKLEEELRQRGINILEIRQTSKINIPAVPVEPAVKPGKEEEFKDATRQTLEEVGLGSETTSEVLKYETNFTEPESDRVFSGPEEQRVVYYLHQKGLRIALDRGDKKVKVLLKLPGGKIGNTGDKDETVTIEEGSGYATMLDAVLNSDEGVTPVVVASLQNRGTGNHIIKADYSLDDRKTDTLIVIHSIANNLREQGIEEVEFAVIGDSMGGHVASRLAETLPFTEVILVGAGAYSKEAETTRLVYQQHKELPPPYGDRFSNKPYWNDGKGGGVLLETKPDDSPAFSSLSVYLTRNPDAKVLIINYTDDAIIPQVVKRGYPEAVRSIKPDALLLLETQGAHGATTSEELLTIRNFMPSSINT